MAKKVRPGIAPGKSLAAAETLSQLAEPAPGNSMGRRFPGLRPGIHACGPMPKHGA